MTRQNIHIINQGLVTFCEGSDVFGFVIVQHLGKGPISIHIIKMTLECKFTNMHLIVRSTYDVRVAID